MGGARRSVRQASRTLCWGFIRIFLCGPFFKFFIVIILLLLLFFVFNVLDLGPWGMWDPSSLTKN